MSDTPTAAVNDFNDLKDFHSNSVFNPFHSNRSDKYLGSVDPDSNFINLVSNVFTSCNYHYAHEFKKIYHNADCTFSTLHWNVRSLFLHYDVISKYLASLSHQFSVLAFTETWINDSTVGMSEIPNYNSHHLYRSHKIGGGTSLFIHNSLQFSVREDLNSIFINTAIEANFVEVTNCTHFGDKNVIVGCIYRPPDPANMPTFIDLLSSTITLINKENKPSFLLGDFNSDLLKYENQSLISDYLNLLYSSSFYPLIFKPTRVTASSATLIDNIFTNSLNSKTSSGILFTDITDHYPIYHFSSALKTERLKTNSDSKFRLFTKKK